MGNRVKIKDIAEKCGLSNTLVSLVLNDKAALHGIKADTQEKVLFVAQEMGYFEEVCTEKDHSPTGSKTMVGIIVPELNQSFLFKTIPYLNSEFTRIGLSLCVILQNNNEHSFGLAINKLKKSLLGIILYSGTVDNKLLRSMKTSNYPFTVLENFSVKHGVNNVNSDVDEACNLLTGHMIKLGYKEIVIINNPESGHRLYNSSLIKDYLKGSVSGSSISCIDISVENAQDGNIADELKHVLRPPKAAEIIVVLDPELVEPLLTFLKRLGIRIPNDVAVISMDEGHGFNIMDPPVTSIRRNYEMLARKVSQMLWTEIKNDGRSKYKRTVKVKPELIIRYSCGDFTNSK